MPATRSVPSPVSGPSNRAGRASESRRPTTRSLSRITEDDSHDEGGTENNVTPRQSTHRRQASLASGRASRRSKSHTALSMTERASDIQTPRVKRAKIRPSLAGPLVHEMNIDTRAQILIPIAEDCIVQLLKAGLNGTIYRRNTDQSWRLAWDSLESQRRNKLFSPGSLPFNDFEDVREAFHASVRGRINTASLERAIHLSNLATFLWVILQPDEAHTLLGGREQRSNASTRSNRRLGSLAAEEGNPDIRDTVSRRNRVFGMAWKRYWKDVIPQNMRGNRHAIQLWARLSVQIMMIFRSSSVDGKPNDAEMDLPEPDPEVVAELFSASAIARYGQWTSEVPSAHDAEIKDRAQRRWIDVAKQGRTELREVREDVLVERYPYDEFRRDMLAFIDEAVLHTLISHSVSPRKPTLDHLDSSASTSEQDDEDVSQDDKEGDAEEEADITFRPVKELHDTDPEPSIPGAEPQSDAESAHESELDLDLDLDILGQILQEMTPEDLDLEGEDQEVDELETDENDFPSDLDSVGGDHGAAPQTSPEQDELEEVDDDITVDMDNVVPEHAPPVTARQGEELETDSDDFPSDLNSGDEAQEVEQGEESESDWIVKDAPIAHTRTRKTERNFEFAARQVSAAQVAWDSQSLPHTSRRTARTPLFLPHQGPESETSRSASATPRPHTRASAEVNPRRTTQSRHSESIDHNRQNSRDDLDDMMPASSILGTPRVIDLTREDVAGLAPSPMPRDQSTEAERGFENEQMQDDGIQADPYHSVDGDHELPSNSPSPQRPNTDRVGVDMLREPNVTIPASSRIKPTSSNRLAARSQRVLADPRKRRRIEADFASASSSDDDVQILDLPQIHASSTPRAPTRRPQAPLAEITQNIPKQSPRSPITRRRSPISKRDFIIVPKTFRRAPSIEHVCEADRERTSRASRRSVSRSTVDDVDQDIPPQTSRRSLSQTEHNDEAEQAIASRTSQRSVSRMEEDDDVEQDIEAHDSRTIISRGPMSSSDDFLHDKDGSPLEPDPTYTIPAGHVPLPSLLHGRIDGQVSSYSRMTGGRRWTYKQQLLLYRTIQKVPLDQPYPCRVVWYLHGEYGVLSHRLEDYNPQHMKDKMKTIVQVRYNNESPVEGRARFWLPPVPDPNGQGTVTHPKKLKLQRKVDQACKKRKGKEREIYRARAEEALRKKDEEKAKKAAEREKAKQAKKGKGKGKGKGRKRAARSPSEEEEEEDEEDEEDGEEEEQVDTADNAEEGEDEVDDPGPSNRTRRPIRATQTRKAKTLAAAKRKSSQASKAAASATVAESDGEESSEADEDQAPGPDVQQTSEANDQNEEPDQEQAQAMEVDSSPDADVEQASYEDNDQVQEMVINRPPHRRRQIPYVELRQSRSSSRAPRAADLSNPDSDTGTSQQTEAAQLELGEDQLDSLETIYEAPSSGKMMKRTPHQPVLESLDDDQSATDTDNDTDDTEVDDDDEITSTGDDAREDEALIDVDQDDEAGSSQEQLEQQSPKPELESEEDETDKYARIADMNRLKQKVLGGWEE